MPSKSRVGRVRAIVKRMVDSAVEHESPPEQVDDSGVYLASTRGAI